jgi:Tol biopolymer transport system component
MASLLILIAALTLVGAAHAASVKLNPTPPGGGSRVQAFALTPDGARVIYRADLERVGAFEVYNVAIGGGDHFKISGPLVDGGSVATVATQLAISKNGARVVYIADADTNDVDELYSVTVGGTDRVKLNLPLGAGRNVSSFAITADSSRVVYIADQQTAGVKEIYSVPIAGGEPPIKLNNAIAPGGGVIGLVLSPDGSRAIYLADEQTPGVPELWSASVFGGGALRLHVPLAAPFRVTTFQVPAAGSRVVFTIAPNDQTGTPVVLYSAPVDASASTATQIASDVIPAGALPFAATFVLSPDGSHVVYTAKAVGGVMWLFASPPAGGTPARLNDDPRTIARVTFTLATFSPDSTRVVYPAGDQLWAVSVNGGAVTSLSGPMVAGGSINLGSTFAVTPDNQRVVYIADQETFQVDELFSVPLAGGEVTKLNRALAEDGDVSSFVISPNSGRVVYRAEQDTKNLNELYAVPVAGGAITKLSSAVATGGGVTSTIRIGADSQRVVYLARQDSATVQELYSAPLFGPPTTLAAAVLPTSRSVQVGSPATVFATIVNAGPNAGEACAIAPAFPIAADFFFQMTDPHTNALVGSRNTPAEIPAGGSQSFVLQLTPTAPMAAVDIGFTFQCANAAPAPMVLGLNTLLLSAATTPVPDVIALAATLSGDGIVTTVADVGVFAVATSNVGAGGAITVSTDTGLATGLPIVVALCQSDPVTAACVNPTTPALSVTTTIGAGGTQTFSLFVQAFGAVAFDPGVNRIFVRFKDGNGITRGATSVAVRTQ